MATGLLRHPVHLAESVYGRPASFPGHSSSRAFHPLCLRWRNSQITRRGLSYAIRTSPRIISSFSSSGKQRTVLFAASNEPPRRSRFEASRGPQILTLSFNSVLWDIIFQLPRIVWGLLTKEESVLTEIEEDVDKVAEFVKEGAKTIVKTANVVESIADVVEEDAEKVIAAMDKVEKTTKKIHKELDDAFDTLEGSIETVEKSAEEVKKGSRIDAEVKVQEKISDTEAKEAETHPSPAVSTPRSAEDGTNSKFTSSSVMVANWLLWNDLWKGIHDNFLDFHWIVPKLAVALALVIVQLQAMVGLELLRDLSVALVLQA